MKNFIGVALCLLAFNVNAVGWICRDDGRWDDASCWSSASVPLAGQSVDIRGASNNHVTVNYFNTFNPDDRFGLLNINHDTLSPGSVTFNVLNEFPHTLNVSEIYVSGTGTNIVNQSGGSVNMLFGLTVGKRQGETGFYHLSGGELYGRTDTLIGSTGKGEFLQTGGIHTVRDLFVGNDNNLGDGIYTLNDGELNTEAVLLANGGTGNFIQNGGVHSIFSSMAIGNNVSGNGFYELNNGELVSKSIGVGINGTGGFTQNGGVNTLTKTLVLAVNEGSKGSYNLNGGTLKADTIDAGNIGATFNFSGGNLSVNAFIGDLENNGGVLMPGNSPGTTNIIGGYTQSSEGTLQIELGGLLSGSEYDVLDISGMATLGGTLDVDFFDHGEGLFNPNLGDSFDILLADTIIGEFDLLTLAVLGDGLSWDVGYLTDAIGSTDVVRLSVVSAVPVPAAVWLFGSGLIGLIGLARRKA